MKVAYTGAGNTSPKKWIVIPVISFERPEVKELQKHEYLTFKLRSVPTDENSTTYDLTVPFFKSGTCEQLLICIRQLQQVLVGQNVTQGPGMYAVARRIFQGDTLAVFDRLAADAGPETDVNFNNVVAGLKRHVFP